MLVNEKRKRSTFEYEAFYDGSFTYLALNAKKYSKNDAVAIAAQELDIQPEEVKIANAYVYFGFGVDEQGCLINGWWLNRVKTGRCTDVIVCGDENAMRCF